MMVSVVLLKGKKKEMYMQRESKGILQFGDKEGPWRTRRATICKIFCVDGAVVSRYGDTLDLEAACGGR